ncbi:hypothetical protein AB835_05315 [Candidatus Endobugula sertula]|uniref:Uncharacterized protein n=1 Tax=Candidatus Endobugula sertula TaxID=62101 RepID=A0A1D2QRC1_9GAMM|nr:hypothetical protein AB835_05315 [Candidatus Endobugula sertula]
MLLMLNNIIHCFFKYESIFVETVDCCWSVTTESMTGKIKTDNRVVFFQSPLYKSSIKPCMIEITMTKNNCALRMCRFPAMMNNLVVADIALPDMVSAGKRLLNEMNRIMREIIIEQRGELSVKSLIRMVRYELFKLSDRRIK